jgi:hypothetical protein
MIAMVSELSAMSCADIRMNKEKDKGVVTFMTQCLSRSSADNRPTRLSCVQYIYYIIPWPMRPDIQYNVGRQITYGNNILHWLTDSLIGRRHHSRPVSHRDNILTTWSANRFPMGGRPIAYGDSIFTTSSVNPLPTDKSATQPSRLWTTTCGLYFHCSYIS